MVLLCGCTKSNIVQPDAGEAESPDFNIYNNIELDMDQFRAVLLCFTLFKTGALAKSVFSAH